MKKINKIAVILVAIMTAMVSGCKAGKADIDKAPFTGGFKYKHDSDNEAYLVVEGNNKTEFVIINNVSIKGRRNCKTKVKPSIYYNDNEADKYGVKLIVGESVGVKDKTKLRIGWTIDDCPPEDRLNETYTIVIKCNYGTYTYRYNKNYEGGFGWVANKIHIVREKK